MKNTPPLKVKPPLKVRKNTGENRTGPRHAVKGRPPQAEGSDTKTARPHVGVTKGQITAQQRLFVENYLVCRDAAQAARDAGYSAKSAHVVGPRLLNHHLLVKALVEDRLALLEQRAIKKADDVLRYVHTAMFYNPLRFFRPGDSGGWLIDGEDFENLPDWVGCMIEEMEHRTKQHRDGTETTTLWVRLVSKTKMAELAARHQLGDKVTVTRVNLNWDDLINAYDPSDPLDMKNDPIEAKLRALAETEPKALSSHTREVVQGLVELLPPDKPNTGG